MKLEYFIQNLAWAYCLCGLIYFIIAVSGVEDKHKSLEQESNETLASQGKYEYGPTVKQYIMFTLWILSLFYLW